MNYKERENGIGASEIAAIMGISPFQTPWSVYARKKGLIEPEEATARMRWGTMLQQPIARMFSESTGLPHKWWDKMIRHPQRHWQFASPDALVFHNRSNARIKNAIAVLDAKNIGLDRAHEWDKDANGWDAVPDYYAVQSAWQMSVTELDVAYLAPLIGGNDFRVYKLERDRETEAILLEEGERFWKDHLSPGIPPPIDSSPAAASYLKKRFPREKEQLREAAGQEIEWLNYYAGLRHHQQILDDEREGLENKIKEAIGDAEGLKWEGGKFTWKKTKDSTEVDWEALARDQIRDYAPEEQAAFLEQFSSIKHGYRRIYFKAKEIALPEPSKVVAISRREESHA